MKKTYVLIALLPIMCFFSACNKQTIPSSVLPQSVSSAAESILISSTSELSSSVPSETASISASSVIVTQRPVSSIVSNSGNTNSSSNIEKTMDIDFDMIDKVTIASGNTGKHYDILGKENIQEFFSIFKDVSLDKYSDQRTSTGFVFSAALYKANIKLAAFNFGYDKITVWENNDIVKYTSSKNIDASQIKDIEKKYNLN